LLARGSGRRLSRTGTTSGAHTHSIHTCVNNMQIYDSMVLWLAGRLTNIAVEGDTALAEAIQTNNSLQYLDLDGKLGG